MPSESPPVLQLHAIIDKVFLESLPPSFPADTLRPVFLVATSAPRPATTYVSYIYCLALPLLPPLRSPSLALLASTTRLPNQPILEGNVKLWTFPERCLHSNPQQEVFSWSGLTPDCRNGVND